MRSRAHDLDHAARRGHTRCVSRSYTRRVIRSSTTVHTPTTIHPSSGQLPPCTPTWLAWVIQYDGMHLSTDSNQVPLPIGPHEPPEQREQGDGPTHRRAHGVHRDEVADEDAEHREGDQPDEHQGGHLEPARQWQAHAEGDTGRIEQDDAHAGHHVPGQHLGGHVARRRQRREPELPVPANRPFGRDARPAGDDGGHRAPGHHAGHVVEREGDAQDRLVPVRAGHEVEEHEGEHQREDEEAHVPEHADELEPGVGRGPHRSTSSGAGRSAARVTAPPGTRSPGTWSPGNWSSPVRLRNACSSPAPRTSRSRASG